MTAKRFMPKKKPLCEDNASGNARSSESNGKGRGNNPVSKFHDKGVTPKLSELPPVTTKIGGGF